MICKFCEEYETVKKFEREIRKKDSFYKKVNTHFKVCLYTYNTMDGRRKGSSTYRSKDLNFCPTCGKKLNRKKLNYEQSE